MRPVTDRGARAARARTLAGRLPASSEPLTFYAHLLTLQDDVAAAHPRVLRLPSPFAGALDDEAAADALPMLLTGLLPIAPPAVTVAARELLAESHAAWRHLLHTYWHGVRDDEPLRCFLAEALLQPFSEAAAFEEGAASGRDSGLGTRDSDRDSGLGIRDSSAAPVGGAFRQPGTPDGASGEGVCRICGDRPVVAVLREESHGARRSLVCGFCLSEWPAPRIACLACGERQFEKLAVYRAEELPGVRIDACDTCLTYVKTIDLTLDATAVPVVDDIASVALDLWSREHGHHRLRPNLLRL